MLQIIVEGSGADFWRILKQKCQDYNFIYIICAVKLFKSPFFLQLRFMALHCHGSEVIKLVITSLRKG